MDAKNPQFPKLTKNDRLTPTSKSNIRGVLVDTYKGGVPQYTLPKDSPYVAHDFSGGEPAKQGPLQPGKDFKNRWYRGSSDYYEPGPSRDYDDYQVYN